MLPTPRAVEVDAVIPATGNPVQLDSVPELGVPRTGTLSNCTGLPVSGITSSTSTALGVGSLELGHATDTTIARSSAGVISVEGVVVPTISSTNTFTNKSLSDSTTFFIDETDGTKKMQFQLSSITTATTRTLTVPDVNGTIVTTGDTGTVTSTMIADGTIVNADINASAGIVDTKLATISTAGKVSNSATTATSANTASAIVARDASGNFTAGTVTAALTGNASTATTLATARAINGVSFNGSADITVTAAAGTLSGNTLASGVTASSLTSVGTLTGLTVSGALTVSNGSTTANGIKFGADPGGGSGDLAQINYYASTGETTVLHIQVDNDADDTIKLDGSGGTDNVGAFRATGEITAYYSDERLKNFSGKIDGALDKVMALNGYYYTENELAKSFGFKNDTQQVGVSAQQVQSVLPEAVRVAPFVKEHQTETEYLTVQYEKLVPLLIEAIKEQQKKIEELEAKINKQ